MQNQLSNLSSQEGFSQTFETCHQPIVSRNLHQDSSHCRHFEEQIKPELRSLVMNFDEGLIMKELSMLLQAWQDYKPTILMSSELRDITRRFGSDESIAREIIQQLCSEKNSSQEKLVLSQTLKYVAKTKQVFEPKELEGLLMRSEFDVHIRSEFAWALGYCLKLSPEVDTAQITESSLVDINKEAKMFLLNILNERQVARLNSQSLMKIKTKETNFREKMQKSSITKNQQIAKSIYSRHRSEETNIEILSFLEFLKSRSIKTVANSCIENLPFDSDRNGNDRSFWDGTYTTVKSLYKKVFDGESLKTDDKDQYLPGKFFNLNSKYFAGGLLGELLIDIMISEIFKMITGRKNKRQKLHQNAITKLMELIDNFDKVKARICSQKNDRTIRIEMKTSWRPDSDLITVEKELVDKLKNAELEDLEDKTTQKFLGIFNEEVQKLRRSALSIIYNAVLDKSLVLCEGYLNRILTCTEDQDIAFRGIALEILCLKDDPLINYKELFKISLNELINCSNTQAALRFISSQSKSHERCQEVFDLQALEKLNQIICNNQHEITVRTNCSEIVNNYLCQCHPTAINSTIFEKYIPLLSSPFLDKNLEFQVLTTILLVSEIKKELSPKLVEELSQKFYSFDERPANLILMAFAKILEKSTIHNIEPFSIKLLDDSVINDHDSTNIEFEKPSKENKNLTSISSIACKIFESKTKKGVKISQDSVMKLVASLDSKDRQTCILASKTLYFVSKNQSINKNALLKLSEYTKHKILDVEIFSLCAFVKGVGSLANSLEPLPQSLIELLPNVYVFSDLYLSDKNYKDEINNEVLFVLEKEASKKQKFICEIFLIFNQILFAEQDDRRRVISILRTYTDFYPIPENTILLLEENIFNDNTALYVLQNVIKNRQVIGERTIQALLDTLYFSEDEKERNNAFELLGQCNQNQDLPESAFKVLQLERAAFVIKNSQKSKNKAIDYLSDQVLQGFKLPINTLEVVAFFVDTEKALQILLNVARNKQIIPYVLLEKFQREFNPSQIQKDLLQFFANLIQNGQMLTQDLLERLECSLEINQAIKDDVLSIFVFQGQRGEQLSEKIIALIFQKISNQKNIALKNAYLSSICTIIQTNENKFQPDEAQRILGSHLQEENLCIQEICLSGLRLFRNINNETKEILIQHFVNMNLKEELRDQIKEVLSHCKLTDEEKCKIKLTHMKLNNEKDLEDLEKISTQTSLLNSTFLELASILDSHSDLILKALEILIKCKNIQEAPNQLISSILTLVESTNLLGVKNLCYDIFENLVSSDYIIDERLLVQIYFDEGNPHAQKVKRLISIDQNIHENLLWLTQLDSEDLLDLKQLNIICKKLQEEAKTMKSSLIDVIKKKLIMKKAGFQKFPSDLIKILSLKCLAEIFVLILNQQPDIVNEKDIIDTIEEAIFIRQINKQILEGYQYVIKMKASQNFSQVVENLVDIWKSEEKDPILLLKIEECIGLIAQVEVNTGNVNMALEEMISSEIPHIRNLAFRGLRYASLNGNSLQVFKNWCVNTETQFYEATKISIQGDLDFLEALSSLYYFDRDRIKKDKSKWKRDLLISDLVQRLTNHDFERIKFYQNWLEIESFFESVNVDSEKLLSLICEAFNWFHYSFDQLSEILIFLKDISYDEAIKIFENSIDVFSSLKQNWINKRIKKYVNESIDQRYIQKLSKNMLHNFSAAFIINFLDALEGIQNFREFENLLDFCSEYKVKLFDINCKSVSLHTLEQNLQRKVLCKIVESRLTKTLATKLSNILDDLLQDDWTFKQLKRFLDDFMKAETKADIFVATMEMMSLYKLSPSSFAKIDAIFSTNPSNQWLIEINKLAVEKTFQKLGSIKCVKELTKELTNNLLDQNENSSAQNSTSKFENQITKIKDSKLQSSISLNLYCKFSLATEEVISSFAQVIKGEKQTLSSPFICEWDEQQIYYWTKSIKKEFFENPDYIIEALSVSKRANYLHTGFQLNDAQLLSCLIALNREEGKGIFLQVATGEGKSTIVSVLAIIHALQGKKVDIITSSSVLAQRDAKEKAKLYKMFGLSCSDNADSFNYITGPKKCYKADIVYGEISQFQFDVLRNDYSKLNTLAGRPFEIAIVDEVDSMLIDDSSKIARLSTKIAGMDQLEIIYHNIWYKLNSIKEKIIIINTQSYLLYGKVSYEGEKLVLEYENDEGEIMQIEDLKAYLNFTEDISHIGQPIQEGLESFLKKHLLTFIQEFETKNVKIPTHLKGFVQMQLPKWIDNALLAFEYQENVHYVVQKGKINPVDFYSTGIIQGSTHWGDGLHAFLQIKHRLKVTPETWTTNFISNVGYLQRYGTNLYGVTGTLGSKKAWQVMEKSYNVDLIKTPSLRKKQYIEFPAILLFNSSQWLEEICQSTNNVVKQGRGVLVVCETIESAQEIAECIKQHCKILPSLYTMNNMNQEKVVERIEASGVIVSTNLAGRGTDIKTDDQVEERGGMHVIVTFLPRNRRVEEQVFGRTSRQGKKGTGQLILNIGSHWNGRDIKSLKEERDLAEWKELEQFENIEFKAIQIKDQLFSDFCYLLDEIRYKFRSVLDEICDKLRPALLKFQPTIEEINVIASIEEQWALFLREIDDGKILISDVFEKYTEFKNKIKKDFENSDVIKNPFHYIVIANKSIINQEKNFEDKAKKYFEKALILDKECTPAAHVGIGWLLLATKNKEKDYKPKAIQSFKNALKIIDEEMNSILSLQMLLNKDPLEISSDLSRQLIEKVTILGSYKRSLETMISVITKSRRLIEVCSTTNYQSKTRYKNDGETENENYHTGKQKQTNIYFGAEKGSRELQKNLRQVKDFSYQTLGLIFHDLTVRYDCGDRDQAVKTISKFSNSKKSSKFLGFFGKKSQGDNNNIKIASQVPIPLEELLTLFNPNIDIVEISQDFATLQLESKKSSTKVHVEILEKNDVIHSGTYKIPQAKKFIKKGMNNNPQRRITLKFLEANKDSRTNFMKVLEKSRINMEFIDIEKNAIQDTIKNITYKQINISLLGNGEKIFHLLCNFQCMENIGFQNLDENAFSEELLFREAALNRIKENITKEDYMVKVYDINKEKIQEIANFLKNSEMEIDLEFQEINMKDSFQNPPSKQQPIKFNFDNLNSEDALIIVQELRKVKIEFTLEFHRLNLQEAELILEIANTDQETIEITNIKTLDDFLRKGEELEHELEMFTSRGIEYLLETCEKQFIPWFSILAMSVLAGVQMGFGGVCIASGFGATFGTGIMTEGAIDFVTAFRAYKTRNFSWSDYGKQKVVSLAVSAVSMGCKSIKDAGKGLKNMIVGVPQNSLKEAGSQIITKGRAIGETAVQSAQSLKGLALGQNVVSISQEFGKEFLNNGIEFLSKIALNKFKPEIYSAVHRKIVDKFSTANTGLNLQMFFRKFSSIEKPENFRFRIEKLTEEILNPKNSFLRTQFESIALPLCKGILSQYSGNMFSLAVRIAGNLFGMFELIMIIDYFHTELLKKLSNLDQDFFNYSSLLQIQCHLDKTSADAIVSILKKNNIIYVMDEKKIPGYIKTGFHHLHNFTLEGPSSDFFLETLNPHSFFGNPQMNFEEPKFKTNSPETELKKNFPVPSCTIQDVDFGQYDCDKGKVIKVLESLNNTFLNVEAQNGLTQTMNSISEKITDQIIQITQTHLIFPWSSYAVSLSVNKVSKEVQNAIIQRGLKEDVEKIERKVKDLEDEPSKTAEQHNQLTALKHDLEKKNSLRTTKLTFSDCIQNEAKKYTEAYSQCEISYHGQNKDQKKTSSAVSKEVEKYAGEIKNGEPADLTTMQMMADENKIPIKFVDSSYRLTEEDKANDSKVMAFIEGEYDSQGKQGIGHFVLMQEDGTYLKIESDGQDCGYAIFAKLTGKTILQLRHETANRVLLNPKTLEKALEAQTWIINRNPEASNTLLFRGGCTDCLEIEVDEKEYFLVDKNNRGIKVKKTWYKTIKDASGTVKKIGIVFTEVGTIVAVINPVIGGKIMTVGKAIELSACAVGALNELYKTGKDHGILSKMFALEIGKQALKNLEHLPLGRTNPKIKSIISKASEKIFSFEDLNSSEKESFLGSINNHLENSKMIIEAIETGSLDKNTREAIKEFKKGIELASSFANSFSISQEIYSEIVNWSQDGPFITDKITKDEDLSKLKKIADEKGEYKIEPVISVQALTKINLEKAKNYYKEEWDHLSPKTKSHILEEQMRKNNFPKVDDVKEKWGYYFPFLFESKLNGQIQTILKNPDQKHVFCANEEKMGQKKEKEDSQL